jgi:phage I-like protein
LAIGLGLAHPADMPTARATQPPAPRRQVKRSFALPAWGTAEQPPREFKIFEYGANYGTKAGGSPEAVYLTPENAARIVAEWKRRGIDGAGDYEHALPHAEGAKPASCWFELEARVDGLWAVNVRWTPRALAFFQAKEYRYFSPFFYTAPDADGRAQVVELTNLALTNWPATDGQKPLIALARRAWTRGASMNATELAAKIQELLTAAGLDEAAAKTAALEIALLVAAPAPEAPAEAPAAEPMGQGMDPEAAAIAAAARSVTGQKTAGAVAGALQAMGELTRQAHALSTRVGELEREARERLISDAIGDGRLTPAQKAWARKQSTETLKGYLAVAVPQGPGAPKVEPPAPSPATPEARAQGGSLTEEQSSIAKQLGIKPEAFSKKN